MVTRGNTDYEGAIQTLDGHCQVDEKLVDRPPRYWAPARREPAMLGIIFGPTGAPLLAQELGRQDVLILLAFAWVAGASTMRRGSWRSVVMAVGSIFGMLAHEAYLVLMIPTVLAVLFMTGAPNGKRRLFFDWGTAVVPPVIVGLAIAMAPWVEGIALTDLVTARAAFEPAPGAIIIMQMTLWGNLEATRAVASAHWCRIGGRLLGSTLLLTPLFVCGCLILRREPRLNSWRYPLAVAATCSPVLLFPVAFDWGRWVAFSVFNVGALGLVSMLSAASPCRTENPHDGRLYLAAAGYGLCLTTFFVGMFKVAYGLHVRGWSSVVEHVCAFGCG